MKFSKLTVRKIRFIMAGIRKYRQNVWNILDPSDKQNHKQFNKTLGESS